MLARDDGGKRQINRLKRLRRARRDDKVSSTWMHWEARLSTWARNVGVMTISIIDNAWVSIDAKGDWC